MSSTETDIGQLLEPIPSIECLVAQGFNEDLGDPEYTTLHPLDPDMLEVICRDALPDVPLERLSVAEAFLERPLGFEQIVTFASPQVDPFQIKIIQCNSHFDAISRMKQAVCSLNYVHSERGLEAAKDLGNYAVKSKNGWATVWTRWTTVVQVHFPDETENIEPSELPFPTHCLAIALDRAMESHRGTIDEVPRAGLDEDFTLPDTYSLKFHETAIIKAKFSDGIHRVREYRVVQGLKTCVVEDDITTKHGRSEMAGGRFHSKLKVTFCRKDISVSIRFLTAHKSSLWPRATELELPNGLN
ncbi:hypothetical protein QR685DRAFT_446171 [Neurospora intermedia]|uniref:Uncharacterized protein n=1 Tax=Neurospora intermedia TaxID=5142 RepID=A0ABR3D6D7_NEUIN